MMEDQPQQPVKQKTSHKKPIVFGVAVALIVLAVAAIVYVVALNNPVARLVQSIKATSDQKMLQATVTTKPVQAKDGTESTFAISNAQYKNGSGLAADATGHYVNEYGDITVKSNWVIAPNNSVYVRHELTTVKASDAGKKLMTQYKTTDDSLNAMMNRDAGTWSKLGDSSSLVGVSYGFDPCVLRVAYTLLSGQDGLGNFLEQLAKSNSLSVKSSNGGYDVTVDAKSRSTATDLYKKSGPYKALEKCVNDSNSSTVQGGLGDFLTDAQLRFDIDASTGTIKKITYTPKDGIIVTVTVGIAHDVAITIPTVTPPQQLKPGETPEQYLQRTRPFVYKHLQEIGSLSKGQ